MRAHPATCALIAIVLTCARADVGHNHKVQHAIEHNVGREHTDGCLYSGRWFNEGVTVSVRDTCLRCRCVRGALSCARAACAPAPDPPPKRCALLHRRGACCPELHCPDGVKQLELSAEQHFAEDILRPSATEEPGHACVEEGGVYAAGSALSGRAACEHCFCLRGARRCVRPRCLPPPPGCSPRPAPPSCCPQRYYCHTHDDITTEAPRTPHLHDCQVNGEWVQEGDRVPNPVSGAGALDNCTQCFCLRGGVRCQQLACAPVLRGCSPLLRIGQCCPHQYHCPNHAGTNSLPLITDNALLPLKTDERSLRTSTSAKITTKSFPGATTSTRGRSGNPSQTTSKVKRKTEQSQSLSTVSTVVTVPVTLTTTAQSPLSISTEQITETTLQPDNSIKVIINGTINCTAELSSDIGNSSESSFTVKQADDTQPSKPQHVEAAATASETVTEESQVPTTSVVDIITRRADYDEQDSFTVNVSSSLRANTSHSALPSPPSPTLPSPTPTTPDVTVALNVSKAAKEDYDYDYTEPTLPPSLPNLKIIPFVAADAVVDEEEAKHETVPISALEREDKFPVYYPSEERIEPPFADRRLDSLDAMYPALSVTRVTKPATTPPITITTRRATITTPEVNLFSPPVETEGGFIPKGPGIIDEYYAVYPNSPPPVPHLTTSMSINPNTPDTVCITEDGVSVSEGESVRVGCNVCTCAWGELSCTPMRCPAPPPGCTRRANLTRCCGLLVCDNDIGSSYKQPTTVQKLDVSPTTPLAPFELDAGLVPFDPPPDRSEPPPQTIPTSTAEPPTSTQPYTNVTLHVSLNKTDETSEKPTSVSSMIPETSSSTPSLLTHPTSAITTTTMTAPTLPNAPHNQDDENITEHHSQEYDEEEEDEGFSFGSVLKLLLSDGLENATPSANKAKKPTTVVFQSSSMSTTTKRLPSASSRATSPRTPFLSPGPPPSYPYTPPKKTFVPNTVNRIDHLVLGEATAIRKPTPRPVTTPFRPLPTSSLKRFTMRTSTRRPLPSPSTTLPPPAALPPQADLMPVGGTGGGGGAGLFKLAGCNIYGQMYRVGRIIAELSTPCQECRCTEVGVQCAPLHC